MDMGKTEKSGVVVSMEKSRMARGEDAAILVITRKQFNELAQLLENEPQEVDPIAATYKLAGIAADLHRRKAANGADAELNTLLEETIGEILSLICVLTNEDISPQEGWIYALRCCSRMDMIIEFVAA